MAWIIRYPPQNLPKEGDSVYKKGQAYSERCHPVQRHLEWFRVTGAQYLWATRGSEAEKKVKCKSCRTWCLLLIVIYLDLIQTGWVVKEECLKDHLQDEIGKRQDRDILFSLGGIFEEVRTIFFSKYEEIVFMSYDISTHLSY